MQNINTIFMIIRFSEYRIFGFPSFAMQNEGKAERTQSEFLKIH